MRLAVWREERRRRQAFIQGILLPRIREELRRQQAAQLVEESEYWRRLVDELESEDWWRQMLNDRLDP